jgi:hypothetical protein
MTSDTDIKHVVLALIYENLISDLAHFEGISHAAARMRNPKRFNSHLEVERTRLEIVRECARRETGSDLTEFLSTRWLEQFRPLAM